MYKLPNGDDFSEDQIQSFANRIGVSFDQAVQDLGAVNAEDDGSFLEDTGQFFLDKAASLVSATSSLAAGAFDFAEGLIENSALAYMDASDYFTDEDYTEEDRKRVSKRIEDEFIMDSNFNELAAIADSYRTKYNKDMFDSFGDGDYLAATDQVISGVVGAIPSIAATMYGGWAGLIGLGVSEAGASYEELSEAKTGERGLAMFGNALAQGTIEAASEGAMKGTFGWLGKVAGVKTAAKEISSRIVFGALSEGISETSAGEFNNYLDGFYTESKFYDKDGNLDIKNISKRIGETMLISGIVGGGMTSIGEISAGRKKLVISNLTPADYSKNNVKHSKELIEKTAERKNFINSGLDTLSIDKDIAKIKEKINYNNDTVEAVVSTYTREEIIEQLSIKGEITDLETQIKNTNANELSKESLQKELDKKKEQQNVFFNDKKQQLQKKEQEVKYNNAFKDVEKIKEDFDKIKDKSIYSKEAEKQLIKNGEKVEGNT